MQDVKVLWQETTKTLQKVYDSAEADNISCFLLEDVFGISKADILVAEKKAVDLDLLSSLLERLLLSEPLQYVTGRCDFYGRIFKIRKGALIPRPETEELCQLIIWENDLERPRILDVGTGSGCIAITLALETGGEVFGLDISKEALTVARENSDLLGAEVLFSESDILTNPLPVDELDILVSNPPYIPFQDQKNMRANVLEYEPKKALFVPDEDPLIFYRAIAKYGTKSLRKKGKLYFEIHEEFSKKTSDLLSDLGYSKIEVHQDMQGKDRMISAVRP
ncbi:MAG: peptide chain release factor N(5)-glutamine methyltransferase [Ekhidna sp.]|nr:peptide chain release factor N(5)-glutamine methyltransferase [Ekhidna sp.]